MRFVIYGAGAIGAALGGCLHRSGQRVVLIARGAHSAALREGGLRLQSHDGVARIDVPVADHPGQLALSGEDVVILAMKTQHATAALDELSGVAPQDLAIACVQNGVESERLALRRFERVQGICTMCPAAHLEPGSVQLFGTPLPGFFDVGRYPAGSDALSERLASAFRAAGFGAEVRANILAFKYGKLLFNLGNAIEVVCGPAARKGPLADIVQREALDCLRAARVEHDAEGAAKRARALASQPLGGMPRPGGSSWQSAARGTGNVETDYLNGEIVLLGRLAGVPTPANALLQRLSNEVARARRPPGLMGADEFLATLARFG